MIYLDNNSTTVLDEEVADCLCHAMRQGYCNPASQHRDGRRARQVLERSREEVLRRVGGRIDGMSTDRCIFTSGGTEANNLAIRGLSAKRSGAVIVSTIEHPSILEAVRALQREGRLVRFLPVEHTGVVDLSVLREWLEVHRQTRERIDMGIEPADSAKLISMVSVMSANNETGIIQPIVEVSQMCRDSGVLVHTDAVQAIGKMEVSFENLGVDAMSVAAHKIHGPIGIGGLILRNSVACEPILYGGFQQDGLRSGTESVVLSEGFAKTLEVADRDLRNRAKQVSDSRDEFEKELQAMIADIQLIGVAQSRLPNTCCLAFPGCDRQSLQMALDLRGIACSTGSACASGSGQPSHVLMAMGLDLEIVQSAIRLSLSKTTTPAELHSASKLIGETVRHLRTKN